MTGKQIIIDYKNLCENYSKEVGCYATFDGSCNKEQCFTYKLLQQLQAKEQECERLKGEIKTNGFGMFNIDMLEQLDQLKRQHQADKGLITATGKMNYQLLQEYDKLKTEYEELKNFHINLVGVKECEIKELLTLKQTLAEIKEMCNSVENIENVNSLYDAKLSGMYLQANKILQKISECEVGNEN